ncbi:MAG: hypothetical protein IKS44_02865 [Bacteroidales bacterium]|nr:hypothetical protein [Bacteroidales bacterium]
MQNRSLRLCLLLLAVGIFLPGRSGAQMQKPLVPESFRNFELGKGDTLIFKYNQVDLDAFVKPVTLYDYRSRRGDLNSFYEGFLWYHQRGTSKSPYWVYHSDFPDTREGTFVSFISDIPLVLIDIQKADKRVGNPFDILLLNTRYGDTVRFRKYRNSDIVGLPDSVYVPRLERQLKERMRGGRYYVEVDSTSYREGDEVVVNANGTRQYYRCVRVVDCTAKYSLKNMWVPNFGNIAEWTGSYHAAPSEPVVHIVLEDGEGLRVDSYNTQVYTYDDLRQNNRR